MKPACSCLEKLDTQIRASHGHGIDFGIAFNARTGKVETYAHLVTERTPLAPEQKRRRAPIVPCYFCPVCGKRRFPKTKTKGRRA